MKSTKEEVMSVWKMVCLGWERLRLYAEVANKGLEGEIS